MKKFLTYAEISEHIQIPLRTLYFLNSNGLGPRTYKIGKAFRVHISDYAAWLATKVQE